ncbi:MAG: hypothetical protein EB168_10135 [Euryarchaeota archaeon]|nr:hypothetical protein [Euryarchaeota archaeon]
MKKAEVGISSIGWDPELTRFETLGWVATGKGVLPSNKTHHPDAEILTHFSKLERRHESSILDCREFNTLVAIVAAMTLRARLRLQCPVVSVMPTETNIKILESIFHAFGQVTPIEINPNVRTKKAAANQLKDLHGIPVLATCANPEAVVPTIPVILLSDTGMRLTNAKWDPRMQAFSDYFFPELLHEIIKVGTGWFSRAADTIPGLVQEGVSIMRYLTGEVFEFHQPARFPILFSVFGSAPSIPVRFNLEMQKVLVSMNNTVLASRHLVDEFNNQGVNAEIAPKGHVLIDAAPVLEAIEEFYGSTPLLESFDPEHPELTVQEQESQDA